MATNWCNLLQLKPAICLLKKELVSLVGLENIVDVLNLSFDVCFRNVFHSVASKSFMHTWQISGATQIIITLGIMAN